MYETFYGLTSRPFHTTPDPHFLFLSPSHKEALGAMLYGIEAKKGFIAITGEVGVGKTTIVQSYLKQIHSGHRSITFVSIYNPNLTFHELLKAIFHDIGQEPSGKTDAELVRELQTILIQKYRDGIPVVLLIDEAQNMPSITMERLRMLSNLETTTDKLLQIVLIGQPELEALLERHELRQLRQRIAVWATIKPLTRNESHDYIIHRLAQAGLTRKNVFSKQALRIIIQQAAGIPRRLNILCDNALITGMGYQENPVSSRTAKEVIYDLDKQFPQNRWPWAAAVAACIVIVVGALWVSSPQRAQGPLLVDRGSFDLAPPLPSEVNAALRETSETTSNTLVSSKKARSPVLKLSPETDSPSPSSEMHHRQVAQEGDSKETLTAQFNGGANSAPIQFGPSPSSQILETKPLAPAETATSPDRKNTPIIRKTSKRTTPVPRSDSKPHTPSNVILAQSSSHQRGPGDRQPTTRDKPLDTRIVQYGDTLNSLTRNVYGNAHPKYIARVLKYNPQIKNARRIFPGQKIVFPDILLSSHNTRGQ